MPETEIALDERAADLLAVLTSRVRVLTIPQIARTWFQSEEEASSEIERLAQQGLVAQFTEMAHPVIDLPGAVVAWNPGLSEPNFGSVAYELKHRWIEPVIETPLVIASRAAKRLFGGYIGGRQPRLSEVTHDIHLSQVYLQLRERQPERARFWISEHQLAAEGLGRREKLPDAEIRTQDPIIIEFGGSYSKQKLERFHDEFRSKRYEIW